jgi:Na+/pantothenate symporter
MLPDSTVRAGFARPAGYRPNRRRSAMLAQLIASLALVVSIAVAATAVSIGIARADALTPIKHYGTKLATASIVAVVLVGMGGLTAIATRDRQGDTTRKPRT